MQAQRIIKIFKWELLALNVLFLLAGSALITLGACYLDTLRYFDYFAEEQVFIPVITLISTSGLLVLLSALGFYAVLKRKSPAVNLYSVLLFLVLIAQFTGGILVFTYQDAVQSDMRDNMINAAMVYQAPNNSIDATNAWDRMQLKFHCCGIDSYEDWDSYRPSLEGTPDSCGCNTPNDYCNLELNIFADGCYTKLVAASNNFLYAMSGIALVLSLFQLWALRLLEYYKQIADLADELK